MITCCVACGELIRPLWLNRVVYREEPYHISCLPDDVFMCECGDEGCNFTTQDGRPIRLRETIEQAFPSDVLLTVEFCNRNSYPWEVVFFECDTFKVVGETLGE